MTLRICITGPEATGKSSLTQALARQFNCPWVPEYARTYLKELGRPYQEEDLEKILEGQIALENEAASSAGEYLFCDTGPEVIWVWSHYKYGRVSPRIDAVTRSHSYPLTLLLETDLPWASDPLRENPSEIERKNLLQIYKMLLKQIGNEHAIVSGSGKIRTSNAIRAIQHYRKGASVSEEIKKPPLML